MKVLAICTLVALAVVPLSASAQSRNCAAHETVVERLLSGYGEHRRSIALGADNTIVETFYNVETGSWTITVTRPGGPTCLVASGMNWQEIEPAPAGEDM